MKILQLSDYHYRNSTSSKNLGKKIISKLGEKLKKDISDQIDFIFFTGDLVFSGQQNNFAQAYKSLITELNAFLNVKEENIIICGGNHDVNWEEIQRSIKVLFNKEINSDEALNELLNSYPKDFRTSLKPLKNFNNFSSNREALKDDKNHPLYSTHLRTVNNRKVGIATINTAWQSNEGADYGKLLFPTLLLDEIEEDLEDTDLKLILFHHPFSWFKEFNQETIRNRIFSFFNIGFCGHEHQNHISSHWIQNEGILINQNPACLTFEKGRPVGLTLIDIDVNHNHQIQIAPFKLDKEQKAFIKSDVVTSVIPHGEEKANQNRIRQKIKSKLQVELSNADALVLYDGEGENSFNNLFSEPSLKTTPKSQMSSENFNEWFNFDELYNLDKNYLILGPDKSGKTSILKKLQVEFLDRFPNDKKVPFYIDYKELEAKSGSSLDLLKHIRDYFEINLTDTKKIIEKYDFVFLLDNFINDHFITDTISKLIEELGEIKLVICGEETSYNILDGFGIDEIEYQKLFIHDLKRKQIRKFSNQWQITDQQSFLVDRIVNVCKQLELPFNYWTISLLLLIHKKTRVDASKNLFEILDLCIDEILDKKRLVLTQQKLNFDTVKNLCAELAYNLLMDHREKNYSASYSSNIEILNTSIQNNPRISAEAKEVLEYLINTGILKEKQDGFITFRLNGFLEYFLAKYLTQKEDFKDKIISDNKLYLSFKNELELYSGFRRDDEDFLKRIFDKTQRDIDVLHDRYSNNEKADNILKDKISLIQNLKETAKKLKGIEPLDHDKQDLLKDENDALEVHSDVHKKKIYIDEELTPEMVEKYLKILSRVLKNSIEVNNYKLVYEIFDYLLESYIYFGFYLIDEIKNNEFRDLDKFEISDRKVDILKIISSFVPVLTQVQFFDGLGNHSLVKIIEKRISTLKKDANEHQYALFMLYFLLLDIDLENQKNRIDEIIDLISLGVLKTSVIIKLNYYLAFKAYNKPKLENFIREKIRKAQREIGQSSNSREFNKQMDTKTKKNIVKRTKEK